MTRVATSTTTARDLIAARMPERELHNLVVALLHLLHLSYQDHGIRVYSVAGLNDLTIVGPGGVIFVELKTERGKLSAAQQAWRASLLAAGHVYLVWRPSDWLSGEIERVLRRLATPVEGGA